MWKLCQKSWNSLLVNVFTVVSLGGGWPPTINLLFFENFGFITWVYPIPRIYSHKTKFQHYDAQWIWLKLRILLYVKKNESSTFRLNEIQKHLRNSSSMATVREKVLITYSYLVDFSFLVSFWVYILLFFFPMHLSNTLEY